MTAEENFEMRFDAKLQDAYSTPKLLEQISRLNNKLEQAEKEKEIVRSRLLYHFLKTDGTWNIPQKMPFMKEFLNDVAKLAEFNINSNK